jgi:hypothetical protein
MKKLNYSIAFTVLLATLNFAAQAQLSITAMNTPVTEDFTGFTGTGFDSAPSAGQLDSDTWRVTGVSDPDIDFGGSSNTGDYARGASAGGVGAGGIYGFNVGAGNVSFGFQPGGSDLTPGDVTLKLINNTGQTITELDISYDIYVFNDGARGNDFHFSHSIADAGYTSESSLDFTSSEAADGGPAWVLTNKTITLTGLSIANGANYYLQWNLNDNTGGGSRDEFGLDNVTVTAISPMEVNFVSATYTNDEGDGTMDLEFSISDVPSGSNVTVDLAAISGTAVDPADYTIGATTVTFPDGDGSNQTITVTIVDDALVEASETVDFEISNPTGGAIIGTTYQSTLTITDNDQSNVAFANATQTVSEGVGNVNVDVTLDKANADNDVTVDVYVIGGTATEGADYTYATFQTVTFTAGTNTTQTVTFPVTDDAIVEGNENIVFELQNSVNAVIITPTQHNLTITDDDRAVTFSVATDQVNETGTSIDVIVNIDTPDPSNPTSVDVVLTGGTATEGADFTYASTQTVTFPAGDGTPQIITIPIIDDTDVEGTEGIELSLANPTNGAQIGTPGVTEIDIIDDDIPTVEFVIISQSITENGGNITAEVTLNQPDPDNDITLDVIVSAGTATIGSDFTYTSPTSITFSAGSTTNQVLLIPIVNDAVPEADENFVLALTNVSNAQIGVQNTHDVTIINDDRGVLFATDNATVNEGAGTIDVTVSIQGADPANATTVEVALQGGTAINGIDYSFTSPTVVTFPAGDASDQIISIPITDDSDVEPIENILLALQNATNGALLITPDNMTIDIQDNDLTTVSFVSATQNVNEAGVSIDVVIEITSPNPNADTEVDLTLGAATATNGVDFNYTLPTTLVFPAGSPASQVITIPITDDTDIEGDEDFTLELSNPTNGAVLGTNSSDVITIIENDFAPEISFTSAVQNVLEDAGTATITLSIVNPQPTATTVDVVLNTVTSTATEASDFDYPATVTVTFPANDNSNQTVIIPITDDLAQEADETIVFDLANENNSAILNTATHTVTIVDNDLPAISFVESTMSVDEGAGTITIVTKISEPADCSASYVLVDETATDTEDMIVFTDIPVSFSALLGADQPNISAPIIEDLTVEGDETFLLILTGVNPLGTDIDVCRIGLNDTIRVTIADNEVVPTVEWETEDIIVVEDAGTIYPKAIASEVSDCKIAVKAIDVEADFGTDVVLIEDTLRFTASTLDSLETQIIDDLLFEGITERVLLILDRTFGPCSIGEMDSLYININDNETAPTVQWETMDQEVTENIGTIALKVSISEASANCTPSVAIVGGSADITIDYTFNDPTVVNFVEGGSTNAVITLTVIDDVIREGNEDIVLQITTDPTDACLIGTPTDLIITIKANDVPTYILDNLDDEDVNGLADSLGVTCKIKATVQRKLDVFGNPGFWMNDGTGAITAIDDLSIMSGITSGDSLLLEGTINQINGHTVFNVAASQKIGTQNVKAAYAVGLTDEVDESQLITISCLTLANEIVISQADLSLLDASGNFVDVIFDDFAQWDGITLKAGAYQLTGFVLQDDATTQFDEDYKVVVRELTDLDVTVSASFAFVKTARTVDFTFDGVGADSYAWGFDDGTTETIQNPSVTYSADGSYTVTLTATVGGCEHTSNQVVDINTVSVEELALQRFVMYPNPSGVLGTVTIESEVLVRRLVVFNHVGQQIINSEVNSTKVVINNLATAGVYIVQLHKVDGVIVNSQLIVK